MLILAWVIMALFLLFTVVPIFGSKMLEGSVWGGRGYWESLLAGLITITALLVCSAAALSVVWAFMFLLAEYL